MQYHDTETLVDGLENNTKRYVKIISEAADAAMPPPSRLDYEEDTFDILYKQVCILHPILHQSGLAHCICTEFRSMRRLVICRGRRGCRNCRLRALT